MAYLLIRFFERITVVLIGGMAIRPGFRLFSDMSEHKNSLGKLVIDVLSRASLGRVRPTASDFPNQPLSSESFPAVPT